MSLCTDDPESSELCNTLAELDISTTSCHVSRDGYRILLSSVCNYLSLKLVELGIEHLVRYLSLGQHMTEFL